jgi:integrase
MTGKVDKYRLANGDAKWLYVFDGKPHPDGRRNQIKKRGFNTQKAAADAMRKRMDEPDKPLGLPEVVESVRIKVSDALDQWLEQHVRHLEAKTAERYADMMQYVRREIGTLPLVELKPMVLQVAFNNLYDTGGKNGRKLSARTIRNIATTFSSALNKAIDLDMDPRFVANPMAKVILPKVTKKKKKIVEARQYQWLFEIARGHPWLYAFLVFDADTGLRRGEVLALQWSDIDFFKKEVRVAKSLSQTRAGIHVKSTKEDREDIVALPEHVISVLQRHRVEQEKARKLLGPDYRGDLDLVFADADGDYLKPDSVTAKVSLLMRRAGLEGISLHSLRHSHGSHLINRGMSLAAVSGRLRHGDTEITARVYSHQVETDHRQSAEIWDDFMREICAEVPVQ